MGDVETVAGLPIIATGIDVVRGNTRVLKDIDVVIEARRRTFILGPNGAGKSMLLRVLHGLIDPTRGVLAWGDNRATRPPNQAMVFQRPVLLRRSAAANVRHALALAGIRGDAARLRVHNALASVGLTHAGTRPARVLSGGEQQRLALARAWALDPDVLFLDEPTASLDPAATCAVEDIVADFHARGTTIVMTTHSLPQARRLADTIVFMSEGRVVEQTAAEVFFNQPRSPEGGAFLEGERW